MNNRQFFDRVAQLRRFQKEYFRTRSKLALEQSKALEKEIDNEISRIQQLLSTQAQQSSEAGQPQPSPIHAAVLTIASHLYRQKANSSIEPADVMRSEINQAITVALDSLVISGQLRHRLLSVNKIDAYAIP